VAQQIAGRMHRIRAGTQRRFGIGDGGQHLVVHGDAGGCAARGLRMVGGHDRDRLALVAHLVDGEHRLVRDFQAVQLGAGHVLVREHGVHPGQRKGFGHIDTADPGTRMWAAQCRAPQHIPRPHVGGVRELAENFQCAVGSAGVVAHAPRH
jgi:hypothetical protein